MMLRYPQSPRYGLWKRQRGTVTLVVGLTMLLMLTGVAMYSTFISTEEQKTAANHWRTADAFAQAEQGLDVGFTFFDKRKTLVNASSTEDVTGDLIADLPDAWFPADGAGEHWARCAVSDIALPCGDGTTNLFPGSVVYSAGAKHSGRGWVYKRIGKDDVGNPFDTAELQDRHGALKFDLFMLAECARPDCAEAECSEGDDCRTDCSGGTCDVPDVCAGARCSFLALDADGNFSYSLMAQGYSDDDAGRALVRSLVAANNLVNGSPAAPIIAAGAVSVSGDFTVVANPDAILYENDAAEVQAWGSGVPLSVWSASDVSLGASTQTCHLGDYLSNGTPNDDAIRTCDDCDCPANTLLTGTSGGDADEGVDIVDVDGGTGETPDMVVNCPTDGTYGGNGSNDSEFPCDLFEYLFGVRGPYSGLYGTPVPDGWWDIREAAEVISNCSALNATSSGLYWYEGAGGCTINNATVGSWKRPVLLVVDGVDLTVSGKVTFFGLIFSLDRTGAKPQVSLSGGPLIYGSIIVDHEDADGESLKVGGGTARYDGDVLANLSGRTPALTYLPGGWSDFPPRP